MKQFKQVFCSVFVLCIFSVSSNASDCSEFVERWTGEFKEQSQLPKEVSQFYQDMEVKAYDIYIAGMDLQDKLSSDNRRKFELAMRSYIFFLDQSLKQVELLKSYDSLVKQKLERFSKELKEYRGASFEDKVGSDIRKACIQEKGRKMFYYSKVLVDIVNYYGLYGINKKDKSIVTFFNSIVARKKPNKEDIENILFMRAF